MVEETAVPFPPKRPKIAGRGASAAEDAGRRLKKARERLNLRYRDVKEASLRIAERHHHDGFTIALSRLADIENKGAVPSIYRLYSLCAIYRINLYDVLGWYGMELNSLPADSLKVEVDVTHPVDFSPGDHGAIVMPLMPDRGVDLSRTTHLSRLIQNWGKLPLMLLNGLDLKTRRYGFIGTEDWTMYPLVQPGALVVIDETKKKIMPGGWHTEFERPIYFLEHREGFRCCWCSLLENRLIAEPHPASGCVPSTFAYPEEIEVIGQVTAVAMHLFQGKRRPARF